MQALWHDPLVSFCDSTATSGVTQVSRPKILKSVDKDVKEGSDAFNGDHQCQSLLAFLGWYLSLLNKTRKESKKQKKKQICFSVAGEKRSLRTGSLNAQRPW